MNKTIIKEILIRGSKGETGDTVNDTTAPINAIFYYDETLDTPTGYEDYEE